MRQSNAKVCKELAEAYNELKKQTSSDCSGKNTTESLVKLIGISLDYLRTSCVKVKLTSKVAKKKYFAFAIKGKSNNISRAVNYDLFDFEYNNKLHYLSENSLKNLKLKERTRMLYTIAMSYCCASDLLNTRDQKSPATFFECLIGHLVSKVFGVNPRTQVEVLRLEEEGSTLPTDFIFDLGSSKPKYHVPVKISTRERVIQVFAHQRVLDGVHGFGKFTGMLVSLAETKLDHKKNEVVEICVPKQWNLYQRFIAQIHRFYYFDIPVKYAELRKADPPMHVKSFAEFFDEAGRLIKGGR